MTVQHYQYIQRSRLGGCCLIGVCENVDSEPRHFGNKSAILPIGWLIPELTPDRSLRFLFRVALPTRVAFSVNQKGRAHWSYQHFTFTKRLIAWSELLLINLQSSIKSIYRSSFRSVNNQSFDA